MRALWIGGLLAALVLLVVFLPRLRTTRDNEEGEATTSPQTVESADRPRLHGRSGKKASSVHLGSAASEGRDPSGAPRLPPLSPERVARLLREIQDPSESANFDSMLPYDDGYDHDTYERIFFRCHWAATELVDAPPTADTELLRIARTHRTFDARCRAAVALAKRGHPEVAAVLRTLILSELPHERYVAWDIASDAVRFDGLPAPIPARDAIDRFDRESDTEIQDRIVTYFGAIRATEALDLLLAQLADSRQRLGNSTAWALGVIGDARAVPHLTKGAHLMALGRIGTPEAIDFVISYLDGKGMDYTAINALVASGSPRALVTLEAYLERHQGAAEEDKPNHELNVREATLGIIRLREEDPCPAFMDLTEDPAAPLALRRSAAVEVRCTRGDGSKHDARMAQILVGETDPAIRNQLAWALEDSTAPGVTESLLHHALHWQQPVNRRPWNPAGLVRSLNRRLGTSFETLDDVQAHYAKEHETR